jgi:aryl-alcohol dehydrogenase-like predicted oxidoreductase
LHHPAVPAAIVGALRANQMEGTIAAASFVLSGSEYQQLRNFAETIGACAAPNKAEEPARLAGSSNY